MTVDDELEKGIPSLTERTCQFLFLVAKKLKSSDLAFFEAMFSFQRNQNTNWHVTL